MNVLLVTLRFPWPEKTGSRRRLGAQIACLANMGELTVVSAVDDVESAMSDVPPGVEVLPLRTSEWPASWLRWAWWLARPSTTMEGLPEKAVLLRRAIQRLVASQDFDLIWVYRLETWSQVRTAVPPGMPVVVDADDDTRKLSAGRVTTVGRRPLLRPVRHLYLRDQARRHRALWQQAMREAVITVSNPNDADVAGRVLWVRNTVRTPHVPDGDQTGRAPVVGFVGSMGYRPNREAALRLARSMADALRGAVPGTVVRVVGEVPPEVARRLCEAGVEVTGYVDDLGEALNEMRAMVIPVTAGSGTRVKAIDAMAARVPIISTAVGVDGLGLQDRVSVRLAETDEQFAQVWAELAGDAEAATALADAAATLFEQQYSLDDLTQDIAAVLVAAGVGGRPRPQAGPGSTRPDLV